MKKTLKISEAIAFGLLFGITVVQASDPPTRTDEEQATNQAVPAPADFNIANGLAGLGHDLTLEIMHAMPTTKDVQNFAGTSRAIAEVREHRAIAWATENARLGDLVKNHMREINEPEHLKFVELIAEWGDINSDEREVLLRLNNSVRAYESFKRFFNMVIRNPGIVERMKAEAIRLRTEAENAIKDAQNPEAKSTIATEQLYKVLDAKIPTADGSVPIPLSKDFVEYLIQNGANVNRIVLNGKNALIVAAENGHLAIVETLLNHNANVNALVTHIGATALTQAAENGHAAIVEMLLDHGADVNAEIRNGNTALILAAEEGHITTAEILLNHGADVNRATRQIGDTALIKATRNGHTAIVEKLLQNLNLNIDAAQALKVLRLAVKESHPAIVKLLLDHNIMQNLSKTECGIILYDAVLYGQATVVEMLLNKGVDVNQLTAPFNALITAINKNNAAITEMLLNHNANANFTYPLNVFRNGETVLMSAARKGSDVIVRALLNHGANANVVDRYGNTARDLATPECKAVIDAFVHAHPQQQQIEQ